jgi:pimeloyl-ACP methyl ester carboxylesterase
MYEFEKTAEGQAVEAYPRPNPLLTVSEFVRAPVEYAWSRALDAIVPRHQVGDGRPVLVLPGFYATDGLTGRLRAHLRGLGYRAYGWGLGRNVGLTDNIVDGVLARFDSVHARDERPVSVIGWSFGGLLARWLAHERPDGVRQVICLGSPWRAEGEQTRATALFERSASKHGLSTRARSIVETLREPLPVPCTAIYSRTDGIAYWRSCALDDGADGCENISVLSSHLGLVSNPFALAAIAGSLRVA